MADLAFHCSAPEALAELEREIRAAIGVDSLGAPAEEPRVERARPREIASVQLEVNEWSRGLSRHASVVTWGARETHRLTAVTPTPSTLEPMSDGAATSSAGGRELLEAARGGDEEAFRRLVDSHRGELHAHCYRMLGSLHDAEDALQDAFLRAWRGLPRFEGRSSVRSWLYRIATNTCLDVIGRRPKRVLPIDYGPPSDPHDGPGEPIIESVWVEPYPDETLGVEDGYAAPEARFERRESIELAFIAALQHLPPNQRAVLILREVLGFSASEVAEQLDTTVASVNSALQRARASVDDRLPEQSQQATLRSLGDDGLREVVDGYVDAWDRGDIEAVVAMLTDDASFSMPPLASWYRGSDELRGFLRVGPLSGNWRWRHVPVQANGQPALAFYCWSEEEQCHLAFALNVFTIRDRRISDVTAFVTRSIEVPDREAFSRWPEEPSDPRRQRDYFGRFGLPDRLD
jgi:RNA polymerase sigma-70 factor, ECF subfamily